MGTITLPNVLATQPAGNVDASKIDANFNAIVNEVNGNLNNVNVPGLDTKEPGLGTPSADGYFLTSTAAGARSWVAFPGGWQNVQVFTGNGTWTKPATVSKIYAEVWGGGASGGGGDGTNQGSGGGGGAYGSGIFTVTGDVTVAVGTGGAGVAADTDGNDGNLSQISGGGLAATLTCGGGVKGIKGSGTSTIGGIGGAPGAGWTFGISGQQGGGRAGVTQSGAGGDSPRGGSGGPGAAASPSNAGVTPGGGSSGGAISGASQAGAAGRVVIYY